MPLAMGDAFTVRELAAELGLHPSVLIKRLMSLGIMATVGQPLPAAIVAGLREWSDGGSADSPARGS